MTLAPAPQNPERSPNIYERKYSPAVPGQEGPLRFEEGLGTDPDVPNDFVTGATQGTLTAPGRPNRNANVFTKPAAETMSQRSHPGSAAWVDAPTFLGEFVQGSFTNFSEPQFEEVVRNGARQERPAPNAVTD